MQLWASLLRGKLRLNLNRGRFEGGAPWFDTVARKMPRENPLAVDEYLDESEVQTRMSYVLH